MPGTLTSHEWIEVIDRHYLADYISAGGASVKFVACGSEVSHTDVASRLQARAESRNFLVAAVDAAKTRVDMIEKTVGSICEQIPWGRVVENVLAKFARESHWQVPDDFGHRGVVEHLNELNGLGVQQISLELQRRIATDILLNKKLTRDFRFAMQRMARIRLETGSDSDPEWQTLINWLKGEIRLLSDLRPFQIFTKVNRSNARDLLGSLLVWIREAGFSGLVVNLDAHRLLVQVPREAGIINYSSAAIVDAYQVFREFIDTTDDLEGLLLNIFVPMEFLNPDSKGRGLGKYSALFDRVYDGVRDRVMANPLTALIRINDALEVSA